MSSCSKKTGTSPGSCCPRFLPEFDMPDLSEVRALANIGGRCTTIAGNRQYVQQKPNGDLELGKDPASGLPWPTKPRGHWGWLADSVGCAMPWFPRGWADRDLGTARAGPEVKLPGVGGSFPEHALNLANRVSVRRRRFLR